MKNHRLWVLLGWLMIASGLRAQTADDQFVRIYNVLQQADQLNDSGETEQAYQKYLEVRAGLKRIQAGYPNWQSKVINFRLAYVADKLAPLEPKYKDKVAAKSGPSDPLTAAKNQAAASVQTLQLENRVRDLAEEVDKLRAEKQILEAKLREALAAQPPSNDPAEMSRAQDKIRALSKEIEVLRVGLEQEKKRQQDDPQGREASQKALDEANRKLASQAETLTKLSREREDAVNRLRASQQRTAPAPSSSTSTALEKENNRLRKELAATKEKAERAAAAQSSAALRKEIDSIEAKLKDQLRQNEVLISEKRTLQARADQLAIEVDQLKKVAPTPQPDTNELAKQKQMTAAAKAEAEAALKDKRDLEGRIAALTAELKTAKASNPNETRAQRRDRTRQLEAERDELKRQLAASNVTPPRTSSKAETDRLRSQLAAIQARVDAYEMKKDPFSPDELALFRKPNPQPPSALEAGKTAKKSIKDLPPSASKLVVEAQSAFSSRQFQEAEKKYEEILRFDLDNVYTLANLALVQMEQGHLDPAESNLNKALGLEPKDAYSLSLLGILKFRQNKLDEALELLSRSVKIDSKNAETHNYLGVVLSQKGLRGPAEAAMRRAIQINPSYAEAHHNLAVIYISQNPPFVELARWHYEKALSAGHPKNSSLENYFDKRAGKSD